MGPAAIHAPGEPRFKRPSFQFYPADWRKDAALQSCSLAARGLWMEILCVAHECEPYGHLLINGKAMSAAQIARLSGISSKVCAALLAELFQAGVASRDAHGAVYSRRMVRDEALRNARAAGGAAGAEHGWKGAAHGVKGGRPAREEEPQKAPLVPPSARATKRPPSSSSSASSSSAPAGKDSAAREPAGARCDNAAALPQGFPGAPQLSEACAFLRAHGRADLVARAEDEAAQFRDHHSAKGTLSRDWPASWRSWMRKSLQFNRIDKHEKASSAHTRFLDGIAQFIADAEGPGGDGA